MKKKKLLFRVSLVMMLGILTGCPQYDYTPTTKQMVSPQQNLYYFSLSDMDAEIEPYAWEELDNALAPINSNHLLEAEIITNRAEFLNRNGYQQLQNSLWRKGFSTQQVNTVVIQDTAPAFASVAVRYRGISYPERCPDWRHSAVINYDNSAMSNFGCATATNLGLMLANPNDLLESHGDYRSLPESNIMPLERLYKGEIKPIEYNNQTGTTP